MSDFTVQAAEFHSLSNLKLAITVCNAQKGNHIRNKQGGVKKILSGIHNVDIICS